MIHPFPFPFFCTIVYQGTSGPWSLNSERWCVFHLLEISHFTLTTALHITPHHFAVLPYLSISPHHFVLTIQTYDLSWVDHIVIHSAMSSFCSYLLTELSSLLTDPFPMLPMLLVTRSIVYLYKRSVVTIVEPYARLGLQSVPFVTSLEHLNTL